MMRSILFATVLVIVTFYSAILTILIGIFQRYSAFGYNYIIKFWARIVLWASASQVEVEGLENISPHESYIVISNHQSSMDIPVLIASLPFRMTIIAKKELFKIPVFGQGMRAFGILEIDRTNLSKSIETLQFASKIIKTNNISILAFPEGTRSLDGQLKPFKKGSFILAIQSQIPILAISIMGTFPILPKGKFRLNPGKIKLIIHPPIAVNGYTYDTRNDLISKTHKIVAMGFEASRVAS